MGFRKRSDGYYAPPKDPDDIIDYSIDYSRCSWLTGDFITDSQWIASDGITAMPGLFTNTTTTVWLSGGTVDETYTITNRVTTDGGRTKDQSFKITIEEH